MTALSKPGRGTITVPEEAAAAYLAQGWTAVGAGLPEAAPEPPAHVEKTEASLEPPGNHEVPDAAWTRAMIQARARELGVDLAGAKTKAQMLARFGSR